MAWPRPNGWRPDWRETRTRRSAAKGANILLFGPPGGGGKSHLSAALGLALIENGRRAHHVARPPRLILIDAKFSPRLSRYTCGAELIEDGVTGLLVPPGDFNALMQAVQWAFDNPHKVEVMGQAARRLYEIRFTPDANYKQLIAVFRAARETMAASATEPASGAGYPKKA